MPKYIALKSVHYRNAADLKVAVEPKSAKNSGLFEHDFAPATEQRLLEGRFIRYAEGVEKHEKASAVEVIEDSVIEGEVVPPKAKGGRSKKPAEVVEETSDDNTENGLLG